MIPAITAARLSGSARRSELPLLVVGPSLGTSATTLWGACAAHLTDAFDVLAWDLPGHGHNRSVPDEPFTMAELGSGVLRVVDDVLAERGDVGGAFDYAGDSVGGCVGLQLLLDVARPGARSRAALHRCPHRHGRDVERADRHCHRRRAPQPWSPRRLRAGSRRASSSVNPSARLLCCSLSRTPRTWGTPGSARLWRTSTSGRRLAEVVTPVLAVAGSADVAAPPELVRALAEGVRDGRYVELDGVAHLAPAETPERVAGLLREHLLGEMPAEHSEAYDAGLRVRREVLGDAHVDRAVAGTTDLTREFQELLTEYAWGSIWTRPGLDRRSRSLIALTALVARGHHEELALHLRAARTNGLSIEEIKELLLQTAVYCGVPDANAAFRIAQQVLEEDG